MLGQKLNCIWVCLKVVNVGLFRKPVTSVLFLLSFLGILSVYTEILHDDQKCIRFKDQLKNSHENSIKNV